MIVKCTICWRVSLDIDHKMYLSFQITKWKTCLFSNGENAVLKGMISLRCPFLSVSASLFHCFFPFLLHPFLPGFSLEIYTEEGWVWKAGPCTFSETIPACLETCSALMTSSGKTTFPAEKQNFAIWPIHPPSHPKSLCPLALGTWLPFSESTVGTVEIRSCFKGYWDPWVWDDANRTLQKASDIW